MAFPDLPGNPSRAILTGEGWRGASLFKHVVRCEDGRYRRLVPDELDTLQTFPRGWTDTGMSDGRRAFCMGNALVVGVPTDWAGDRNGRGGTDIGVNMRTDE